MGLFYHVIVVRFVQIIYTVSAMHAGRIHVKRIMDTIGKDKSVV